MQENKILQKLIEHDERLGRIEEKMPTGEDLGGIQGTMDEMMVILQRLDQERVFTVEWIRRLEDEVSRHDKEIKRVKEQLKIV